MAVTKRTRFEVLKRDGFRCQYCGLPALETGEGLTVDHVVPVALGGTDAPTNLVAACRDCNSGKGSTSLDESPVPAALPAEEQARIVSDTAARIAADLHAFDEFVEEFDRQWSAYCIGGDPTALVPRPDFWESSVADLAREGAPIDLFEYAIPIAMYRAGRLHGQHAEFMYMVGIVRNKLQEVA